MNNSKETNTILNKILEILVKYQVGNEVKEMGEEADSLIKKAERQGEEATKKLQTTLDRIHDKLFTVNSVLIALYVGFAKFPEDNPLFSLWFVLFPVSNMFYLIYLEISQMSIFRHESQRMKWNFSTDVEKFGKMISRQTLKSILAWFITIILVLFLAFRMIF
ncbi:MAG: hypothetical protein AB8B65_07710 [Kordia sp.]|uniref:hypothetical protein n=1 Tax=Kordia sp. TaxID=1965332 RepID=UPI0038589C6B